MQKENHDEGTLHVSVQSFSSEKKGFKLHKVINVLLAIMLYIVVSLTILSMFQIESVSLFSLILGFIAMVLIHQVKNKKLLLYFVVVSVLILSIIFNHELMNGFLRIVNEIAHTIGQNTGMILPQYKVSLDEHLVAVYASIVWALVGIIISIVSIYLVNNDKSIVNMFLMIGLFIFQKILNIQANDWLNVLLFFISIFVLMKSYLYLFPHKGMFGKQRNGVFLRSSLMILLAIITLSILLFSFRPSTSYEKNSYALKLEDYVVTQIDNIRYEKSMPDNLTQGDFTKLSQLSLSDHLALEVIMDHPTSLYLRGFVGSRYTHERWEDVDVLNQYENHGLFYWLNDEGFNPLNQLSYVNELYDEANKIGETVHVTINNLNANSKYLFIPYELSSNVTDFENVKKNNDRLLKSKSFRGSRIYSYEINTDLVTKYPTLANNLYSSNSDDRIKSYLEKENHYNSYVYHTYTKLSKQTENILGTQIDMIQDDEESEGHIAYEKAIDYVREYLNKTFTYKTNPEPLEEGQDFITHVLERSNEGYSVHFATAATVMFRYLGIPARYVEGYLVTPKDIENKDPYEPIEIYGTNAHAWTEIYIDKIGWVPIEVTPPYYETMEQTDLSDYPEGNPSDQVEELAEDFTEATQDHQHIEAEQDDEKTTSEDKDEEQTFTNWLPIIIIIILLIMIVWYLTYLWINRLNVYRLNKSFSGPHLNEATKRLFSYTLKLLHYDGVKKRGGSIYSYENDLREIYGDSFAHTFNKIAEINQMVVYSGQQVTREDYEAVKHFKNLTLAKVVNSKNIFKRLKMRLWDFIY